MPVLDSRYSRSRRWPGPSATTTSRAPARRQAMAAPTTTWGWVLMTVPGSYSTRFGFSSTRWPRRSICSSRRPRADQVGEVDVVVRRRERHDRRLAGQGEVAGAVRRPTAPGGDQRAAGRRSQELAAGDAAMRWRLIRALQLGRMRPSGRSWIAASRAQAAMPIAAMLPKASASIVMRRECVGQAGRRLPDASAGQSPRAPAPSSIPRDRRFTLEPCRGIDDQRLGALVLQRQHADGGRRHVGGQRPAVDLAVAEVPAAARARAVAQHALGFGDAAPAPRPAAAGTSSAAACTRPWARPS